MFNLYGISSILTAVTSSFMAVFVLVKGYRRQLTRIWFLFAFCVAIYGFGAYMVSNAEDAGGAILWWQISYVGVILIPFLFVCFIYEFLGIRRSFFIILHGLATIVFLFANFISRQLFIYDVTLFFIGWKIVKPLYFVYPVGPLLFIFILFSFFGAVIYAHYELIKRYKHVSGVRRSQIKYFFLATAIGFIGGATAFLPCFNIEFYPIFNFTVCLYPLIMTYAIFKYRLMDIRVVVTRAGIFAFVYILVLGLPFIMGGLIKTSFSAISSNWWIFPVLIGIILASIGPFIYMKIQRKVEARLRAREFKSHEELRQLSRNMLRFPKLDVLLKLIVHYLVKILRLKFAAIYIFDIPTDRYILKSFWQIGKGIELPYEFSKESPLIKDFYLRRTPIVTEEVKLFAPKSISPHVKELLGSLSGLKANTIIPSFLRNGILGFLVLSDRKTNIAFTQQDLNLLMVLSNEAALAIENAQFHQKEQSVLAERSRREALADMAPGASHQFNNRLVAISSSAELLLLKLESIKIDAVKDEKLKSLLKDMKNRLELIDKEVYKGKEITTAILRRAKAKVGFQKIDIVNLIKNAYRLILIGKSKSGLERPKDIKFNIDLLNKVPAIFGSEALLQDSFYNLIDNSFDAIYEKDRLIFQGELRSIDKGTSFQGKIEVTLEQKEQDLIIKLKDNGIGVSREKQRKLFTPYFTTKASSDKGSGLGLCVIRDFIEMHKGTIMCDSEYGEYTSFTIKLPIKEQRGKRR